MFKIALIGQVNVGKSTLFNRLIEKRKAIVFPLPGTTRDRNYDICHWRGQAMTIIDTGGLEKIQKSIPPGREKFQNDIDIIEKEVQKQIIKAIDEADFILFICDINQQISNFETEIGRIVRKSKKATILVLNKADNPEKRNLAQNQNWLRLGLGRPMPVSAVNGSGVGDLLDQIVSRASRIQTLQQPSALCQPADSTAQLTRVAIIGRPNVGKSTLINALLGEEKVIVSPLPHTTRGPQDFLVQVGPGRESLLLIDTAGIRKKAKIKPGIEKIGVEKSLAVIEKSDVVLMVLDLTQEIGHQDKALLSLIIENNRGLILVLNKCDLLTKSELNKFEKLNIYQILAMARWAPFIFISAKTGKNVSQIFSLIQQVAKNRALQIDNEKLNEFLKQIINDKRFNPVIWEKIKIQQTNVRPPTFMLKAPKDVVRKKIIRRAQINIIEKQIRKKWGFQGTPIIIRTL